MVYEDSYFHLEVFNGAVRPNGSRVGSHFDGSLADRAINMPGVKGRAGHVG